MCLSFGKLSYFDDLWSGYCDKFKIKSNNFAWLIRQIIIWWLTRSGWSVGSALGWIFARVELCGCCLSSHLSCVIRVWQFGREKNTRHPRTKGKNLILMQDFVSLRCKTLTERRCKKKFHHKKCRKSANQERWGNPCQWRIWTVAREEKKLSHGPSVQG